MSEPASISSGIAARYAKALFEIAKEAGTLGTLESNISDLSAALSDSADLRGFISSPVLSRGDLENGITALAAKLELDATLRNALAIMARNRRLFALPQLLGQLRAMIADDKGEVSAEVVSATELTKAQSDKLAQTLTKNMGKDVTLNVTVDESLIGGLIVKVGSKMIDTSISAKLNSLQNAMKEVG